MPTIIRNALDVIFSEKKDLSISTGATKKAPDGRYNTATGIEISIVYNGRPIMIGLSGSIYYKTNPTSTNGLIDRQGMVFVIYRNNMATEMIFDYTNTITSSSVSDHEMPLGINVIDELVEDEKLKIGQVINYSLYMDKMGETALAGIRRFCLYAYNL